jgi:hypothetical protein
MTVEFLKDGSFTGSAGPLPISGRYATPDERHVRIEGSGLIGSLLGPQVYEAREAQGRLELIAGSNRQEFQRVQP